MELNARKVITLAGCNIDVISWEDALDKALGWASKHDKKYITFCNVHSLVTGIYNKDHQNNLNLSHLVTSDGMPIVWTIRKLGRTKQERINGPDFMWKYCEIAEKNGHKVFFYGSSEMTLLKLESRLKQAFPRLQIAGFYSPPFRELTDSEVLEIYKRLNESNANIVFVGLGCPKQEQWMNIHHKNLNAVLVGVGAAFDYQAGTIKRAPIWMQEFGMEWLYRLFSDPIRLWKRYLVTNTIFIFYFLKHLIARDTKIITQNNTK